LQQYGSEVVVISCGVVVGMMMRVVVVVGELISM
jgi:hypothetical protein